MANYFPKARIDALADGIFAFAMTLLVLDVRVVGERDILTADELTAHLVSIWRQLLTYAISFFVLGALWRAAIEQRRVRESLSGGVVSLWLPFLFFVTMVPFSSSIISRYGELPPAVVLYSSNMLALGVLVTLIRYLDVVPEERSLPGALGPYLALFMASALLSIAISAIDPRHAMFAYFINFLKRIPGFPRGKPTGRDGQVPDASGAEPS